LAQFYWNRVLFADLSKLGTAHMGWCAWASICTFALPPFITLALIPLRGGLARNALIAIWSAAWLMAIVYVF
jgi:hypothetical protein